MAISNRLLLHGFQRGFLILGMLLMGLWSRTEMDAHAFQAAGSAQLEALRAGGEPDEESLAPLAGVLGRLEIPRVGITAIVAEGVDKTSLERAVGHIPTTARPGQPGNCALAGHRDSFLRGLGDVRLKDVIRIVTPHHIYVYEVEWTEVVDPRRLDVLDPTPERAVTLITCYPFRYVGHAPKRFIVRARQVEVLARATTGPELD